MNSILSEKWKHHAAFKVKDAAFILQLSEPALRNYMNQGLIPFVRVGPRRIVIARSTIESILRNGL